ncbi:hypothetical protein PAXRUDRAFT_347303 [Paxillus rubicundulus Ve08.2h10]|uniref:Uncharacterized protein n=1 Tax=Paxillus rubicundulus Ve08.2h10 TaxID=930991 RepID=A0A0D0DRY3_9AGAM|nr:hypothetical protein PAXRUDRAFT_347303 [Paxillus rubicundulus Ve08.2h10]
MSAGVQNSGLVSVSTEVFAKALQIRKAFVGAGHTLLVYEFLLTIDDEAHLSSLLLWKQCCCSISGGRLGRS